MVLASDWFQHRDDAERFQKEFQERLAKFGLEPNGDKTRLIEFGRKAEQDRERRGEGKPETLDFLGFTHYCGKHRAGYFALWRKTNRKRLAAKLERIKQQLRMRRHEPIAIVGEWLQRVITGLYNYHGVPGNRASLQLYSRNRKRHHYQILLGVVMMEGLPTAHHVFAGNRLDKTTVGDVVDDLKKRFELKRVVLVGDRRMVALSNLEQLRQAQQGYLVGLQRRNRQQTYVAVELARGS